jgi:RNA 3'-terminal phosphate cyclase (ATP)
MMRCARHRRQHLTAAKAAAEICFGELVSADLGSRNLRFQPGEVRAGEFHFAVGTAGSPGLVFQTILPALLCASGTSRLTLEGGMHNPSAPPFEFPRDAFAPRMADMGAGLTLEIERAGFYPAGGGLWTADITPCVVLQPVEWTERGELVSHQAVATLARLARGIGDRECNAFVRAMGWQDGSETVRELPSEQGPGNLLQACLCYANAMEVLTAYGERGVPAERVARGLVKDTRRFITSGACVGEYLADQLLLPMAMAGSGAFSTVKPSRHTLTNIAVIEAFQPVHFELQRLGRDQVGV